MIIQLENLLNSFQIKVLLSKVSDGQVNVVIEPKPAKEEKEIPFLQPLCLTGTPEELDAELPGLLTSYTERTASLFEQYETQMADMERAAKEKPVAVKPASSAASSQSKSTLVEEKRQSLIDQSAERKEASTQAALQLF